MTKEQCLDLIVLLSALESLAYSTQKTLPDSLGEHIANALYLLKNEVLRDDREGQTNGNIPCKN